MSERILPRQSEAQPLSPEALSRREVFIATMRREIDSAHKARQACDNIEKIRELPQLVLALASIGSVLNFPPTPDMIGGSGKDKKTGWDITKIAQSERADSRAQLPPVRIRITRDGASPWHSENPTAHPPADVYDITHICAHPGPDVWQIKIRSQAGKEEVVEMHDPAFFTEVLLASVGPYLKDVPQLIQSAPNLVPESIRSTPGLATMCEQFASEKGDYGKMQISVDSLKTIAESKQIITGEKVNMLVKLALEGYPKKIPTEEPKQPTLVDVTTSDFNAKDDNVKQKIRDENKTVQAKYDAEKSEWDSWQKLPEKERDRITRIKELQNSIEGQLVPDSEKTHELFALLAEPHIEKYVSELTQTLQQQKNQLASETDPTKEQELEKEIKQTEAQITRLQKDSKKVFGEVFQSLQLKGASSESTKEMFALLKNTDKNKIGDHLTQVLTKKFIEDFSSKLKPDEGDEQTKATKKALLGMIEAAGKLGAVVALIAILTIAQGMSGSNHNMAGTVIDILLQMGGKGMVAQTQEEKAMLMAYRNSLKSAPKAAAQTAQAPAPPPKPTT